MMKLFLSWSGEVSQQIAQQLRDWFPLILPAVHPFITSSDIDKGSKWAGEIATELGESNFGVLCLTRDNLNSQWLAFEAGALSKHLNARVATILFGLIHSDVKPPLSMFQGTLFTEAEFRKLVSSINAAVPTEHQREEVQLDKLFGKLWPELKDAIEVILKSAAAKVGAPKAPSLDVPAIVEELLSLSRNQSAVLSTPERFLGPVMERLDRLEQLQLSRGAARSISANWLRGPLRGLVSKEDIMKAARERLYLGDSPQAVGQFIIDLTSDRGLEPMVALDLDGALSVVWPDGVKERLVPPPTKTLSASGKRGPEPSSD